MAGIRARFFIFFALRLASWTFVWYIHLAFPVRGWTNDQVSACGLRGRAAAETGRAVKSLPVSISGTWGSGAAEYYTWEVPQAWHRERSRAKTVPPYTFSSEGEKR